jgi:hypothetical protein
MSLEDLRLVVQTKKLFLYVFGENTRFFFSIFIIEYCSYRKLKQDMASSTEPKSPTNEEEGSENAYSVEEDDDDESYTDHFARIKPSLLKTPSILNAIIDQIHPDIISKFVKDA